MSASSSYSKPPTDLGERTRVYLANRPSFPLEEWLRFVDQWVAMSWDGKAILANAPDLATLYERLREAEIDAQDVGFEFVEMGDISDTGGAGIEVESSTKRPEAV